MEKDDLLVSIIVPVYNTAQYLPECIESIIGQTYENLEIFLVDDGSVDGSSELCDLYCEKDHRIQVIHKKNSGVSDSRNLGIQKANGDYLMFVDSDDWLDKSMVEKMLFAAKTFSADLVICGYYNVFSTKRNSCSLPEKNYSEKSFLNDFGLFYRSALINSPCNKLYRMDHIQQNHLCFDVTLSLGEDLLLNLKYLDLCSNIFNLED